MTGEQAAILAGGAAIIGFLYWFFFGAREGMQARETASGVQEATITVYGSYQPDIVRVEAGRPVRLIFDRRESESCSDTVLVPDFGINQPLPAFQKTAVEFTPGEPG